jgi:uncharacterized protein YcgI (DUF1989 family)
MVIIDPKSAAAFEVTAGQSVRVVDLDGGQVADLVAFAADSPSCERLSQNCTRVNNWRMRPQVGDHLFSNRNRVMFTVVSDSLGIHDLLFPPCSRFVYDVLLAGAAQDGCVELLARALAPHGIERDCVTDPLNVFMNARMTLDGGIEIEKTPSRQGDVLELRAEMDLVIGVSACPDDRSDCNNGTCTRIGVEVKVRTDEAEEVDAV